MLYEGAAVIFGVITGPGDLYPVTDVTDASGEATTTLTSNEIGISTIIASTTINGNTITTDGTGENSEPAHKQRVDA